ncbi:PX DOMAIN-CONTAINING PROTEIN EREX [Salix koriyanagi]|uniref:PX DOMAIN-CONTAINING PROTEIN EREX n=1 Tax=Salix koriyanagi TaxID=2511006 RepID=A0A9Q0Q607_9ROSI|nr:PX DOMAIN-CONTAINING PROTEIN EREX [Salix koriyanagi]
MDMYAYDLSLLDFSDPIFDPMSISHHQYLLHRSSSSSSSNSSTVIDRHDKPKSPPRHRHDGTSPLPLGMDWSLPPRKWDGRNSVWPHNPHTGWSYCVAIPSWILVPNSRGSDPVAFYRVQVGVQSPEGFTTTRGILRRFSDFLNLFSELKKEFPLKTLPPAPPKTILRMKSRISVEERRCSLEDWMEKLLSDIDVSRSAPVGTFLELEAAARLSFDDANEQGADVDSSVFGMVPSFLLQTNSDGSVLAGSTSVASYHDYDSPDDMSEFATQRIERDITDDLGMEASTSEQNMTYPTETSVKQSRFSKTSILDERFSLQKTHTARVKSIVGKDKHADRTSKAKYFFGDEMVPLPEQEYLRLDGHTRRLSIESIESDISSLRASEISNLGMGNIFGYNSIDCPEGTESSKNNDASGSFDLQLSRDVLVALPSDQRHKLNRVLNTLQQRLATAKTDMEDLIARLNQEIAVRQFLTTKVKDLEVDLETTRNNCKENMQQTVLIERERFTQTQWDVEELRRQCLDLELKLKHEQDEKACSESARISLLHDNKMLLKQLDVARKDFEDLHKDHEELQVKSKADVKLLVKEVKSLRISQIELKQELSRLMKEKLEVERAVHKEKQITENAIAANAKLLHECGILHNRLEECSVNFLIEEEDKLIVDTSSPSDAIDLLTTSDNRIGLLLAEAQLLAQDLENSMAGLDGTHITNGNDRTDNELRKMLTETFIDNARLRMQVNSIIRCALYIHLKSDKDDDDDEEAPLRNTVLSKFLER